MVKAEQCWRSARARGWRCVEAAGDAPDGGEPDGGVAESGFTLIEMMVVLLIMAILLAIAIPTFLGVKAEAQDRSAQSDLTNALVSAKVFYANNQSYGATAGGIEMALRSSDPAFDFSTGTVTGATDITLSVGPDGQTLIMGDDARDNRCWYLEDNEETTRTTGGNADGNQSGTQGVTFAATPPHEPHPSCAATGSSAAGGAGGPDGLTWSTEYPH